MARISDGCAKASGKIEATGLLVGLLLAYGALAYLSRQFTYSVPELISFHLAGGAALAVYCLFRPASWVWFSLLFLAIELTLALTAGGNFERLTLTALLRTGSVVVAAASVRAYLGHRPRLDRARDVGALLLMPLGIVYPLTALLASLSLSTALQMGFWQVAWQWWLGDLAGGTLLSPLLLVWGQQRPLWRVKWMANKVRESLLLFCILTLVSTFVFAQVSGSAGSNLPYLIYPVWLLIAFRIGPRGIIAATLLIAGLGLYCSVSGLGPFSLTTGVNPQLQLLVFLVFLGVGFCTCLILSILTLEKSLAQRQHRQTQSLLEGLVANIPAAIYVKNSEGRYLIANRFAKTLLYPHAGPIVGKTDLDLWPEETARRIALHDGKILREGELVRLEEDISGGEKVLNLLTIKFPLVQTTGEAPLICGISTDITHLKELEAERWDILQREKKARQDTEALFEESQRLNRLKDEFLTTLSHELRIPLHGILGWTQILCDQKTDVEQRNIAFQNLRRSVEAESRVIDELLDISRILTQKINVTQEWVNLDRVIDTALIAVDEAAQAKNLQIDWKADGEMHGVRGDGHRLEQVLINLLVNAIKFTPPGGRIRVSVLRRDAEIELSVRDSGIGILPENIPHIFKRFWQADSSLSRRYGGLGLGLALVQELVSLHGGRIQAQSDGEGLGATFTLSLPSVENPSLGSEDLSKKALITEDLRGKSLSDAEALALDFDLSQLRLLAIDDDPATCKLLYFLFSQIFQEVKTATSAEEAMRLITHWRPDFILCDIAMPGEDGLSFIKRARAYAALSNWKVHTAALSANADEFMVQQALEVGFEAFITKPVDPAHILGVVKRLCADSIPWTMPPASREWFGTREVRSLPH